MTSRFFFKFFRTAINLGQKVITLIYDINSTELLKNT